MNEILNIQGLETKFKVKEGWIHAVNGVSFKLREGETLGIVGESGCGKSVSMMSMIRLIPMPPGKITAGTAMFNGRDLLKLSDEEMRKVRGAEIAMIYQEPMTAFNPVLTVGRQIIEPLEVHLGMTHQQAHHRAEELLTMVGISNASERMNDYPHQFSGGMRQRAMIAMALVCAPKLLIADEPTTALDVTIQAQIVELVKRLRDELGMAIIWITHDLGLIAGLADRISVMYAGFVIEEAPIKELYAYPSHPYTISLLNSLPYLDSSRQRRLESIEGLPPILLEIPSGCAFAARCKYVRERCLREIPPLISIDTTHRAACWVDPRSGKERL